MADPLTAGMPADGVIPVEDLAARLGVAVGLGLAVAGVYLLTQRKSRAESAPFVTTLVLLTVLIAMVTVVIGDSLARAFGLVGALSIVRFRTVVDDTRDTAFVIFGVVVGMAVGVGRAQYALVAIPIVGAAAWLLTLWGRSGAAVGSGVLVVRLAAGLDPDAVLGTLFAKHLKRSRPVGVATARQGAAADVTYRVETAPGGTVFGLLAELNRTEGVQNVEWKETGG